MNLTQHPLSAAFPAMPESEIEALAEDIKKHGQREPGVLYEGMVLDGWHRYLACENVGIEFDSTKFDGDDPIAFVLSRNLHRRHLTASQRAAAVVAATNWKQVGRPAGNVAPGATLKTNGEMARAAEVSQRTIRDAKVAHSAGLGEAVRDGMLSAKQAVRVANGGAPEKEKKDDPRDAEIRRLRAALEEAEDKREAAADEARELEDKLTMFEATEPDEQQKLIAKLQKQVQRKDGEIQRLNTEIRRLNDKNNALIRQVKSLQKAK